MSQLATATLAIGDPAPDFELRDQHGHPFRLSGMRGQRRVVLVFYPWAFSTVCSTELDDLRDAWSMFASHEVEVVGISCDPTYALRAFGDSHQIEFPLLSDFWPHGAVASAYGVFDQELGVASRSTFIVDRSGAVAWQVHNALPDARNLHEYAAVLDRI